MKKMFKTQTGRFIAGLIALLLLAGAVWAVQPLSALKADITTQKVMTMSDRSHEVVKALDEEIEIYYLATDAGKELWVDELIQRYDAASSLVSYEMIDPAGSKAVDLAGIAGMTLTENSLVVSSGKRTIALSADVMYNTEYNQMYYYYYGELLTEAQYFMADCNLVNAILYVTREDLPVLHALTGHGEIAPAGMMLNNIQTSNVVVETLKLDGEVPADAAAVMVYGPSSDLTDAEADALLDYLKAGGKLILMTDYLLTDMPNLEKVTSYYGMKPVEGLVVDMAAGYCYSTDYPQYLQPDVAEHEAMATLYGYGAKPVISYAGAMERSGVARGSLTVTPLLTTSAAAYLKDAQNLTVAAQEEQDVVGQFTLAMAAEENDSQFVWFSSASFLDDVDIQVSSNINLYLLHDILNWMMPLVEGESFHGGNLVLTALQIPANIPAGAAYAALFVPALAVLLVGLLRGRKKKA